MISCTRLFALAMVIASACAGTDTGNPYPQPLTVDAHSSEPGDFAIAIPENNGGVVVQMWLSFDPFALIPDGDAACASGEVGIDNELDFGIADHAASGVTSRDVEIDAADYCALSVPFALATAPIPAGAPPELEGASITLTGTTAAGNEFTVVSQLVANITLTGPGALAFDQDLGPLFLGFDVATWLDGVDIDAAAGGPSIVIDTNTNSDLLAQFEANLAAGIELYRDLDDNGQADPGDELIAAGQ